MGKFLSKKVIPVLGSSIVVASMTAAVASADGVPGFILCLWFLLLSWIQLAFV